MPCTEEHEALREALEAIGKTLEFHIAEFHETMRADVVTADGELQAAVSALADESRSDRQEIHRQLGEMGDVVLGTKRIDFDGNIIRTGGMKALVADNENGGIKFKWANLIIGALVTVFVSLIGLAGLVVTHQDNTEAIVQQVEEDIDHKLGIILQELEQKEPTPTTAP